MKLKYKKALLLSMMSTMGFGLMILSVSQVKPKSEGELRYESEQTSAEDIKVQSFGLTNQTLSATYQKLPNQVYSPTPIPLPVYDLEENANPVIEELFSVYYTAKNSCDVDKLKSLFTDPSKIPSVDQLQKETDYIDDCRELKCYVKKGPEEGTYVAYVAYEIKFNTINTTAPSLKQFYLVTDEKDNIVIYSDDMDPQLQEYYNDRNNDPDVMQLRQKINKKAEEAVEKDEDLSIFWKNFDEMVKKQ